jgi:GTPase SAR1 family protein
VGDRRVGKKNLIATLFSRPFREDYEASPVRSWCKGVATFGAEEISVGAVVFSGLESIQSLENYDKQPTAVIFVYDLTHLESFEHIQQWMSPVRRLLGRLKIGPIPIFVVGTKRDVVDEPVGAAVGGKRRSRGQIQFMEVSAKRGDNTPQLVEAILTAQVEPQGDPGKKRRAK